MRLAKSLVATGEIELMSTTTLPSVSPAATPNSPNSTSSTWGVSGTMMMITSACRATSALLAQAAAPASMREAGVSPRV